MITLSNKEVIILFLVSLIVIMLFYKLKRGTKVQSIQKIVNYSNDDKTPKLINFNASWCYWSQKLQPTWDKLTEEMNGKDIDILDIKCDEDKNTDLCRRYEIEGFPTIKLIVGNNVIDYNGDRSLDDFSKFIQRNAK